MFSIITGLLNKKKALGATSTKSKPSKQKRSALLLQYYVQAYYSYFYSHFHGSSEGYVFLQQFSASQLPELQVSLYDEHYDLLEPGWGSGV